MKTTIFKKICTNKILIYLASRYGTYAIQFVVSLGIASKLGPYYLGIYGFITLILNYFSQINFGIPHSLNVLMVHHKNDQEICNNYIINSLWIYFMLGCFIIFLYGLENVLKIKIFGDYPIDNYMPLIIIAAVLMYFNSIMSTILRVRNKVNQLTIVQSLNVIFNAISVLLFQKEVLIFVLVLNLSISYILCIIITWKSKVLPKLGNLSIKTRVQIEILHKGIYLFMYNSCFYFILISIRTIISNNYRIDEFGAFTFSFTIAHSVMLLLESLMTIIFPKIIDLLSSNDYEKIEKTLDNIRTTYISTSHFLIYMAMIFFPLVKYILPSFSNAITSMNLISLTVLMNTNSCGYSSLLIAQNKEKEAAIISFSALLLNISLAFIFVSVIHVEFSFVIIATILTYLYFSFIVTWRGKKIIGGNIKNAISNFFPLRLFVPYSVAFIISIIQKEETIWIPLFLYIWLNRKDFSSIKSIVNRIVYNPNVINV